MPSWRTSSLSGQQTNPNWISFSFQSVFQLSHTDCSGAALRPVGSCWEAGSVQLCCCFLLSRLQAETQSAKNVRKEEFVNREIFPVQKFLCKCASLVDSALMSTKINF